MQFAVGTEGASPARMHLFHRFPLLVGIALPLVTAVAEAKDIAPSSASAAFAFSSLDELDGREAPLAQAEKALGSEFGWLQSDPTGTAALTIEIVGTPHFVQFFGNELIFDLPETALSPEASDRARSVMERLDVPKTSISVTTETGEKQTLVSYQTALAGEIDGAVRLALAVLKEIYLADAKSTVRISRIRG
jgi:hypothetical protein